MSLLLAIGYLLWSAFITVAAGFIGAAFNCGEGEICDQSPPPPFQPWRWGHHETIPEVRYLAVAGVLAACGFVVAVYLRRRVLAVIALLASTLLLSYPFFAGLTSEGRVMLCFGVVLGIAAIVAMRASAGPRS